MNKQIEEIKQMACDMCTVIQNCNKPYNPMPSVCKAYKCAEKAYNASYRKQTEGEWKAGTKNGQYGYYCTRCEAGFTGENAEWIAKSHKYCPECGAHMKGGDG